MWCGEVEEEVEGEGAYEAARRTGRARMVEKRMVMDLVGGFVGRKCVW